jgi:hypothetical protein
MPRGTGYAPCRSPATLTSFPTEIQLEIFYRVCLPTRSFKHLIPLAASSKTLYSFWQNNHYVLFRRIIDSLITGKHPSLTVDIIINLASLHNRKPWPLSPATVSQALYFAATPVVSSPPKEAYWDILRYVEKETMWGQMASQPSGGPSEAARHTAN